MFHFEIYLRHELVGTETYRFSATPTLSNYPLLVGEILRRSTVRLERGENHFRPATLKVRRRHSTKPLCSIFLAGVRAVPDI